MQKIYGRKNFLPSTKPVLTIVRRENFMPTYIYDLRKEKAGRPLETDVKSLRQARRPAERDKKISNQVKIGRTGVVICATSLIIRYPAPFAGEREL